MWRQAFGGPRLGPSSDGGRGLLNALRALAARTDSPAVDAQFRFFSEGEYDDARVVGTVRAVTGRDAGRFADWARAHAGDF